MVKKPYLIADFDIGEQKNLEPWLIPEKAFANIENAYTYRGRVKKRRGNALLGNLVEGVLAESLANTSGTSYTDTLANTPVAPFSLSVTVSTGSPITLTDDGSGVLVSDPVDTAYGTINYDTGLLTIEFVSNPGTVAVSADYSFIPARPVMGLSTLDETTFFQESYIGFDTDKANLLSQSGFSDITYYASKDLPFDWNSADDDFFSTVNYQNVFFATNNIAGQNFLDPITNISQAASAQVTVTGHGLAVNDAVYFAGVEGMTEINGLTGIVQSIVGPNDFTVNINTTAFTPYSAQGTVFVLTQSLNSSDGIKYLIPTTLKWVNFIPQISATQALKGCRFLFPYYGRLLAFNTIEDDYDTTGSPVNYAQRIRYSQIGSVLPYVDAAGDPISVLNPVGGTAQSDAWREDIPGKGGFVDAPTNESIVGAYFLRGTLIVLFESSVWQLLNTGAPDFPFQWQRVNSEFGSPSQYSIVGFDKGIFAVGGRGIITSDGNNADRIDALIPNTVFQFQGDNEGTARVHGLRDFNKQLIYWTYSDDPSTVFPNKLLVYNYVNGSWSQFDDSYTCFGYFQVGDTTWDGESTPWDEADFAWNSSQITSFDQQLIAGTPNGAIMLLNQQSGNGKQRQITNISNATQALVTTYGDHNLYDGQIVKITGVQGMGTAAPTQNLGTAGSGLTGFEGTLTGTPIDNGSVVIDFAPSGLSFVDTGYGALVELTTGDTGVIDYNSGSFSMQFSALGADNTLTADYSTSLINNQNSVIEVVSDTTFSLLDIDSTSFGAYTGSGDIAVLQPMSVLTKRFNPFVNTSSAVNHKYTDLYLTSATDGKVNIYVYIDSNSTNVINQDGGVFFNTEVEFDSVTDSQVFKRFFCHLQGQFIQLEFTYSPELLKDDLTNTDEFELHEMTLWLEQAGRITR